MYNSLKKAIYVLLPLLVYYVAHDVARILFMYILQILSVKMVSCKDFIVAHDTAISALISMADMLIGAWMVIILMRRDIEEIALGDYLNLNTIGFYREDKCHPAFLSWIVLGIQGISAAVGLNLLFNICGISSKTYEEGASAQYSVPLFLGIILYGFISPAVEELLFRTVIFGRMKRRFPVSIAIMASSLFFGLYHRNLVQGIYATVMGILLCFAVEYVHSVVGAFVLHSVANLSVYLLSSMKAFSNGNNYATCAVFIVIAVLSLFWELFYTGKSRRVYGVEKGIAYVGCFYVDQ